MTDPPYDVSAIHLYRLRDLIDDESPLRLHNDELSRRAVEWAIKEIERLRGENIQLRAELRRDAS